MQPHPRTSYSLKWADGVRKAFEESYARATDSIKEVWGITDEDVTMWVASRPERWRNYKKLAKILGKWDQTQRRASGGRELPLNKRVVLDALRVLKRANRIEFT